MAKIRYLQLVGSIQPGEVKDVADNCARVLVLINKAEYVKGQVNERVESVPKSDKKSKKSDKQ
ncbi:hypothetical protein [Escherichia albertii]|uniref:hypothetical protein n=1 Tax=Escherichia albertii TaxID=208962 RepID=UPI0017BA5FF3|nr:hypothetical protein [Escherichia albertii]MCI5275803.1 hypothetical protein [Escherichia albertii]MCZ8661449.1 hypothetical protein [Escherichia albertii]MCZ9009743.1 hypothetical protein [Escherichia albertii]HCZ5333293.1 hypothetical protein [Escherichia albertii]